MSFLKNFLSGDKSTEEKAMLQQNADERARDVMRVNAQSTDEDDWMDEAPRGGCGTGAEKSSGGCGGCGCG